MVKVVIRVNDTGELILPKSHTYGGQRVRFKLMYDGAAQIFSPNTRCVLCEGSSWIYHNSAYYPDTPCDMCYGTGWRPTAVRMGLSEMGIHRCTPLSSGYYYYYQ